MKAQLLYGGWCPTEHLVVKQVNDEPNPPFRIVGECTRCDETATVELLAYLGPRARGVDYLHTTSGQTLHITDGISTDPLNLRYELRAYEATNAGSLGGEPDGCLRAT